MPNKKDEKNKKELSEIEEKKLETEVDESDDSKYYDFDDTIKKVFEKIQGIRHLVLAEYGLH